MKKSILLLAFLIFIISACHKATPYYPVDADVKANFDYKVGTYWIYKDALSSEMDSFVVFQHGDETVNNQINNYSFEQIDIAITQYGNVDTQNLRFFLEREGVVLEYYAEYNPFSEYPFQIGAIPSSTEDKGFVIDIQPAYSINGQNFDNVEVMSHIGSNGNYSPYIIPVSWNDTFYFNQSAGIIKMVLNHPQDTIYNQHRVWELQNYHIVK